MKMRKRHKVMPCAKTLRTLHERLCETSSFNRNTDGGRQKTQSLN